MCGCVLRYLQPLEADIPAPITSEGPLSSALAYAVTYPLNRLLKARSAQPGCNAVWEELPPKSVLQDAVQYYLEQRGTTSVAQAATGAAASPGSAAQAATGAAAAPGSAAQATEQQARVSSYGRVIRTPSHYQDVVGEGSQPSTSSSKRKMDLCLMVDDFVQPGGTGAVPASDLDSSQPPCKKRRCVCVGEVKRGPRLTQQSQLQPIDLVEAWNNREHPFFLQAEDVICQARHIARRVSPCCVARILSYMTPGFAHMGRTAFSAEGRGQLVAFVHPPD